MAVGGEGSRSDILSYSPHTQSWVKVGDLPVGLSSTCSIVLPTGELLVMGEGCAFKGSLKGET